MTHGEEYVVLVDTLSGNQDLQQLTGVSCRDARLDLGWSQSVLAKKSAVPFAEVIVFERLGEISDEHRMRLAKALKAAKGDESSG